MPKNREAQRNALRAIIRAAAEEDAESGGPYYAEDKDIPAEGNDTEDDEEE